MSHSLAKYFRVLKTVLDGFELRDRSEFNQKMTQIPRISNKDSYNAKLV